MKLYEQGDVLCMSVDKIPTGTREVVSDGILASGEVTGHHHRLAPTQTMPATMPTLFRVNGVLYIDASAPFRVTHEEHKTLDVPAGIYQVGIVQEYDYDTEESKKVVD